MAFLTLLFYILQLHDTKYVHENIQEKTLISFICILPAPFVSNSEKRTTAQCIKSIFVVTTFSIINILLVIAGLETNPGPKSKINKLSFAVCHLDSIMARNKPKIPIIESLNAITQ